MLFVKNAELYIRAYTIGRKPMTSSLKGNVVNALTNLLVFTSKHIHTLFKK